MTPVQHAAQAAETMIRKWGTPGAYTAFVHQRTPDAEPIVVVAFAPGFESRFEVPGDVAGFATKVIAWRAAMGSAIGLTRALA